MTAHAHLDLAATIRDSEAFGTPAPNDSSSRIPPAVGTVTDPHAGIIERYRIERVAGTGATSHVYAADDRVFERRVAMKYLHGTKAEDPKRLGRFIREAQLTASLEHPHIAPVYDMEVFPEGAAYFTMRLISGASLGDLLQQAERGSVPKTIAGHYERVGIFLKVINAVASAHHKKILHRDIKPDNIMIGSFGEVFLVDWGCAWVMGESERTPSRVVGTPNYMSPEQARGEAVDERSDVYSLGATLFEVLIGRVPTRAETPERFWEMKKTGRIEPLSERERRSIPKQLAAIIERALQADPAERYQNAEALAADLRAWEAGLSVSAYREGMLEWMLRVHGTHARGIWLAAAIMVALAMGITAMWGERIKEIATWGAPILSADFDDGVIGKEWVTGVGSWTIREGRLVSEGLSENMLWLDRPFSGSVAVEYVGRMLPGYPACDVSVAWSQAQPKPGVRVPVQAMLQAGAGDNTNVSIVVGGRTIVQRPLRLIAGRNYSIRMEIDIDRLSVALDGEIVLSYQHHAPFGIGYIALFGYYPGKSFDAVRIYAKGMPEKVSALAAGERDLIDGLHDRAAEHFAAVAHVHAGKAIAEEALYRQGVALWKGDRAEEAAVVWARVSDPVWHARIALHRIEILVQAGDYAAALPALREFLRTQPEARSRGANVWVQAVHRIPMGMQWESIAEVLLNLREQYLREETVTDSTAADLLCRLARFEEVVEHFPHVVGSCANALIGLGRPAESLQRFGDGPSQRVVALLGLGRFDEILAMPAPPLWVVPETRLRAGADPGTYRNSNYLAVALLLAERRGELESLVPTPLDHRDHSLVWAALLLGWEERILSELPRPRWRNPSLKSILLTETWLEDAERREFVERDRSIGVVLSCALTRYRRGEVTEAARLMAGLRAMRQLHAYDGSAWFARLAIAMVSRLEGENDPLQQLLRDWESRGPTWGYQRPWFVANYLLERIDDGGWHSQPMKTVLPSTLLLLQGVRAEMAEDKAAARAAYAAFLAQEPWLRSTDIPDRDPPAELWARWRIQALQEEASP